MEEVKNRTSENTYRRRVDVIIPTYKPGKKFSRLLKMLERQTYPIGRIIVMNTEKAYWNDKGYEGIDNLQVHHLPKAEFDHGATRNRGARYSRADIMIFMTDDAVPADDRMIEHLVAAFDKRGPQGESVIMAYARQLPDKDCPLAERYTRSFNYPRRAASRQRMTWGAWASRPFLHPMCAAPMTGRNSGSRADSSTRRFLMKI